MLEVNNNYQGGFGLAYQKQNRIFLTGSKYKSIAVDLVEFLIRYIYYVLLVVDKIVQSKECFSFLAQQVRR